MGLSKETKIASIITIISVLALSTYLAYLYHYTHSPAYRQAYSQLAFYQSACAELGSRLACGLQLNNTVNGIYIAPLPTGSCIINIGGVWYQDCI